VPDPSYYEMLEIAPNASPEEVREAYRLLTMVWHPDRFPKDSKLWTHANEKMQQINEAYTALKNVVPTAVKVADSGETASKAASTAGSPTSTEEQQRRNWDQEQQRNNARLNAEAQQRRIAEQKRLDEEKRRAEATARETLESEQRRVEADRLRILMRAAQRIDEIKHRRAEQGQCIMCGRALGRLDKMARRDRHKECVEFVDEVEAT